jgi:hypothetical protein
VAALAYLVRGFTVDDALIPARYAHHLATGGGYSFQRGGPVTDGVTPLGFAHLLEPFAAESAWGAHLAAKWLGTIAWAIGASALAFAVLRGGRARLRLLALALPLASLPLAAWSVSGLETGIVTGLVAVGLALRWAFGREVTGIAALGLAAGWRPELLPMVLILAVPRRRTENADARAVLDVGHLARALAVAAPFVAVAIARTVAFGRPAPLSALAKRADLELGITYAIACALLAGPLATFAPRALRRAPSATRWLVLAVAVHLAAVAFAGGDWMPLSRLVVPCLPVVVLAVAQLAEVATTRSTLVRVALALAGELYVVATQQEKVRRVEDDRRAVVEAMAPALREVRVVGALDVGWLGVAAPHATIVDLAGVTDPMVASLGGGHTSKRVPSTFVRERDLDAIVLLEASAPLPGESWHSAAFARQVERRIADLRDVRLSFDPKLETFGRLRYVLLTRTGRQWPEEPSDGSSAM